MHSVQLPEDVKNFYLAINGFELTWKLKLAGKTISCKIRKKNI